MELKEGEVICSKCNGRGAQELLVFQLEDRVYLDCKKCHGTGKLDWIENITGKKRDKIKINMRYRMKYLNPNTIIGVTAS